MARQCGFTLIEMMITVVLMAVLASGLVPLTELASKRSKEAELRVALRQIRAALDGYKRASDDGRIVRKADESGYPPNLEVLVTGVVDGKSTTKQRIYFLRRLPRDPFFADPNVPAEQTWGLRSYDSAFENPQKGKDVYDVYSRSDLRGINGIPYRQW